jgi:nitroreductase
MLLILTALLIIFSIRHVRGIMLTELYVGCKKASVGIIEIIKSRRSIRQFTAEPVAEEMIEQVLEAGRWAPSGLNNQPWRFSVITDAALKGEISKMTNYSKIVLDAQVLIPVFLDTEKSYHREKDLLGVGACLQNILLEAHALGLGAVWLGEIIKSGAQIRNLLGLGKGLDLMAVIALGHPGEKPKSGKRKALRELVVFRK